MTDFSKPTDGFFARHFDRKISGAISQLLLKTPITPNQITITVTLIGVSAGWLLAQPGQGSKIAGAFVFLFTSILDGCDGEVARAKKKTSELGGWLDLWGDNIVHVAVFWGMAVGLYRDSGLGIYLTLGKMAVWGTLLAASLASWQMRRQKQSSFISIAGRVPSLKSVPGWKRVLIGLSDALARRDFVYAVPVLAILGGLSYFLWVCAIGVLVYALVLGILFFLTPRVTTP